MSDSLRKIIEEMEADDKRASRETVAGVSNDIKLETYKTNLKKEAFTRELISGLGEEIRKNPNAVIFTKEEEAKAEKDRWSKLPFSSKLKEIIIKFFTKF